MPESDIQQDERPQPPLWHINANELIPFTPLVDAEWDGTYKLYDTAFVFVSQDAGVYGFGTTETSWSTLLEFHPYNYDQPVWDGWYDLPDGSTLFETPNGVLYLYQPQPEIDLTTDNP